MIAPHDAELDGPEVFPGRSRARSARWQDARGNFKEAVSGRLNCPDRRNRTGAPKPVVGRAAAL
jgi:hypothetical protein